MNKQFLSLLLLTSFVGTMSSTVPAVVAVRPNFILVGARSFGSFMGTVASKVSSVIPKALIATPIVGSVVLGETVLSDSQANAAAAEAAKIAAEAAATEAAKIAAEAAATEAAKIAAANAATEAGIRVAQGNTPEVLAIAKQFGASSRIELEKNILAIQQDYAAKKLAEYNALSLFGKAKVFASNGINTVVSAAKNNPKTAIAAAVVGTAAVGYLAYRLYNRSSISLNEQGRTNLRTALSEARTLPSGNVWATVMPDQLVLVEHFTVESTGLPKTAVKALNEFVTLDGSCKSLEYLLDHQNGRTSPETVAKYKATKPLRDAAENRLKALALPVVAAE